MQQTRPSRLLLDATCPVDFAYPLNRGLVADWTVCPLSGWRGGLVLRDLVRGGKYPHDGTRLNAPPWVRTSRQGGYGALSFTAASSQSVKITSPPVLGSGDFTVAAWIKPSDITADHIVVGKDVSGTRDWIFGIAQSTAGKLGWVDFLATGGLSVLETTASLTLGVWQHVAARRKSGSVTLWINGVQQVTSYGQGSISDGNFTAISNVYLGQREFAGFEQYYSGLLDGVTLHIGAAVNVAALYDQSRRGNPERWRWLRRPAYSLPPAGGSATLAASSGSFVLSGQAATLAVRLPATFASFTLTGQAGTPSASLPANNGSLTLSGQSATLAIALPGSQGSLSLSGQAAVPGCALPATQGSYALSGQQATLAVSFSATAGTFTAAGQTVALAVSLPGNFGAFACSGQTASLLTGKILSAQQASFVLTGETASLAVSCPASTGPLSLTGQVSPLAVALTASQGSYTLAGQNADLVVPGRLAADTGTFVLSSPGAVLQGSLVAGSQTFILAGQAAGFLEGELNATGIFSLTLSPAALSRGFSFSGQTGSFLLSSPAIPLFVRLASDTGIYPFRGQPATLILSGTGPAVTVPYRRAVVTARDDRHKGLPARDDGERTVPAQ